jgi:phage tail-like protein
MTTSHSAGPPGPGFVYANRENGWLDFERRHLDLDRGRLTLARVPGVAGQLPAALGLMPPADNPAGVAVGPDGSVFFTEAGQHLIVRIHGCDGSEQPVPCLGGEGDAPTQLRSPRGLAVHPGRRALCVADTGNHQVKLFSLSTFQLLDIWSGDAEGFETPVALAVDPAGRTYVVDRGRRQLVQVTASGELVAGFGDTLAVDTSLDDPVAVAVGADDTTIFVLDRARRSVVAVGPDGHLIEEIALEVSGDPFGLAATNRFDVGDNGRFGDGTAGRVRRLYPDGRAVGSARGYAGPVAGLALDGRGGLWVHTGEGSPIRLTVDQAPVEEGIAWGGPFGGFTSLSKQWHRLAAAVDELRPGAHLQFFIHTTDDDAPPPVNVLGPDHFPAASWAAGPPDLSQLLLSAKPARLAWIGIRLTSEGTSAPAVEQIRLEFDHPTYLQHLPAVYRDEAAATGFLARFLALAESGFTDLEEEITALTRTLDPAGAPIDLLPRLARWLAVDPSPDWDEAELRDAIADAYVDAASRGTAAGLRAALRRYAGVDSLIEEPITQGQWWALAPAAGGSDAEQSTSVLGVTTMLASAEPQGAVLGSSATLDRSHLISGDEYGQPLFDTFAHRFVVRLYEGAHNTDQTAQAVEMVLAREAPAHTEWTVCRVAPRCLIGMQSRLGIDAIVGGDPPPTPLDSGAVLGRTLVLGGEPPGRISDGSSLGVSTRLAASTVG